jgi:hypothetical protein
VSAIVFVRKIYSSYFKIHGAEHASVASRSGCSTQAVLKLNTQSQQREAVVQGRSLSPIPATVSGAKPTAHTGFGIVFGFVCSF